MASVAPALARSEGLSTQPTTAVTSAKVGIIYNVQALRALAAIMIVALHASDLLTNARGSVFLPSLTAGVDIFFVISGMIMVLIASAEGRAPLQFIRSRALRIVPLYWLATLAVFVGVLIAPGLFVTTRPDIGELIQSLLFIPFAKNEGAVQPMLFVGWTLNYEMLFYLIFGLSLFLKGALARVGAASVALVALTFAGTILPADNAPLAFFANSIMLEFVGGMALGLAFTRHGAGSRWIGLALAVGGAALILALSTLYPDLPRGLRHGAPAMLIVAGAVLAERGGWTITSGTVQTVGAASYALYLSHPFVTVPARRLAAPDAASAAMLFVAVIAAAVVVAVVIHRSVELPLAKLFGRRH